MLVVWGALIKGSDSRATITCKIEITGSAIIIILPGYQFMIHQTLLYQMPNNPLCADVTALSTLTNPQGVYTADVSSVWFKWYNRFSWDGLV
jgi:hypothetical protein